MKQENIQQLQEEADAVEKGSVNEKMQTLQNAFSLFSKETGRLEKAYTALQKRFKEVTQSLEDTRKELKFKIIELDDTNSHLNNLLKNINQGMIFVNGVGSIITFNTSAEKILEVPQTKILKQNFWNHFEDDAFGFSMRKALDKLKIPEILNVLWKASLHQDKDLEISTTFIETDNLNSSGLIVLLRDVTRLKKLQVLATRNDRLKELGEMAASVAHEIRNPLGGIKGFASLLQRDLTDHPNLQYMANAIVEGTDTLNRLVTNVLHYSRPLSLTVEPLPLCSLLNDLVSLVRADPLCNDSIHFKIEVSPSLPFILGDKGLLQSALLNLLVNSLQAMPNGGDILLEAKEINTLITIKIKDTGSGIEPDNLEKIFSPFFTTKTTGTGIGLAEVHKIIQTHGGTIEVQSELNRGTCFTIKLPLKQ